MKKSIIKKITFVFILTFSLNISSQSNLIFNQVLLLTLENQGETYTVPPGKTWKIEHASNRTAANTSISILLDNKVFLLNQVNLSGIGGALWVPEGTEIKYNTINGSYQAPAETVSVLEFNIEATSGSSGSSVSSGLSTEGLQFSRVVTFESTVQQSTGGSSGISTHEVQNFSVPDGKVWKVTNMVVSDGFRVTTTSARACNCSAYINNTLVYYSSVISGDKDSQKNTPLWLNPGSYILKFTDLDSGSLSQAFVVSYSAIEYNIPN